MDAGERQVILALDKILKACHAGDYDLTVVPVEDDATGTTGWQATLDGGTEGASDMLPTPWGALLSLAERLP